MRRWTAAAIVLLLSGCTSAGAGQALPTPTGEVAEPTVIPTAVPSPGGDADDAADAVTRAAVVAARAESELGPDVLPAGYSFIDAVEVDEAAPGLVSHVYGGPEGPTGPTIYVHTGPIPPSSRQDGLPEEIVAALSGDFPVTIQRDVDGDVAWTFITVALPDIGTIRVIGDGVPEEELLQMVERLVGT